jgi:hypothetical protein
MSNQTSPVQSFMPPDWSAEPAVHLEQLRVYAETKIEDELDWYRRNKNGRAATSRRLRFWAVSCTILGGLVPVVVAAMGERPAFFNGWPVQGFGLLVAFTSQRAPFGGDPGLCDSTPSDLMVPRLVPFAIRFPGSARWGWRQGSQFKFRGWWASWVYPLNDFSPSRTILVML